MHIQLWIFQLIINPRTTQWCQIFCSPMFSGLSKALSCLLLLSFCTSVSLTTTQRNPPDHDTISRINSKDTNMCLSKIAMNEIKKHFDMASKVEVSNFKVLSEKYFSTYSDWKDRSQLLRKTGDIVIQHGSAAIVSECIIVPQQRATWVHGDPNLVEMSLLQT